MSSDPSLIHDAHPLSPDPLAPQNVYMTNQGYPNRLSVSWRAEPHGQDGYRLLLYYSGSGILAANTSVGKGTSKYTFSGLAPGQKYLLEVVSMAGPYAASAENISDWTSKWWELGVKRDAQPSPAGQAQLLQREGAGLGLGMLSGSCRYGSSSGIMVWVSQRRGEQAIQLPFGTSPSPPPFSQALRKFLAWEIWGSQAFFFSFFRNVEIADKHNKPFHVLIPTVPALCLGNPEVSAPTLSQPLAGYWESHAEPFRQVSVATCQLARGRSHLLMLITLLVLLLPFKSCFW